MESINTNTDLTARFSPKRFRDKAIEQADFFEIMEAARWAPSAFNEQPWRFYYAKNGSDNFQQYLSALNPKNQEWAQHADILIFTAVSDKFTRNNKPNAHAKHDLGQAVANLSQAAWNRGIGVHQMAGFNAEKAQEITRAPKELEMVTAIALGYFEENEKERQRLDLSEILFENQHS